MSWTRVKSTLRAPHLTPPPRVCILTELYGMSTGTDGSRKMASRLPTSGISPVWKPPRTQVTTNRPLARSTTTNLSTMVSPTSPTTRLVFVSSTSARSPSSPTPARSRRSPISTSFPMMTPSREEDQPSGTRALGATTPLRVRAIR